MGQEIRKVSIWIACLLIGYFLLLWIASNLFVWGFSQRYKTAINGLVFPDSVKPGSFQIRNANFQWRNQFQLLSGSVSVKLRSPFYDFSKALVDVKGKQLTIAIGRPQNISDSKKVFINQVDALVEIVSDHDPVIHSLAVDSPELKIELRGQGA